MTQGLHGIAERLAAGATWSVCARGIRSSMARSCILHARLSERFETEVVPGVTVGHRLRSRAGMPWLRATSD